MADPRGSTGTEVRVEVDGRTLTLSNLGKVLYPETGTTKGEVLHYYAQVAPTLLPHVEARAVTRIRWPHGTAGPSFFEKNVPNGAPAWLRTAEVPREDALGTTWVRPTVVVEVESLGLTPREGRLRQPAYVGLRSDLTVDDLLAVGGEDG